MRELPLLHHVDFGVGRPALVLLPGVGGTTSYWRSRARPLGKKHRLRLVDPLGFGESPKPWLIRYTVDRHAEELHRVLGSYASPDPFVIVGHSFGAILALAYAARWPDRVAGLVLLSLPHFGNQERAVRYFRHRGTAEGWLLSNVVLAAITCLITRHLARWVMPRVVDDLPEEVIKDLGSHTWRSSTSTVWEGVYRHDLTKDAARLPATVPVLLIHGDEDETAPLANLRSLLCAHPQWSLRVLPDVDHHPFLRRTSACLGLIHEFLESIPTASIGGSQGRLGNLA